MQRRVGSQGYVSAVIARDTINNLRMRLRTWLNNIRRRLFTQILIRFFMSLVMVSYLSKPVVRKAINQLLAKRVAVLG